MFDFKIIPGTSNPCLLEDRIPDLPWWMAHVSFPQSNLLREQDIKQLVMSSGTHASLYWSDLLLLNAGWGKELWSLVTARPLLFCSLLFWVFIMMFQWKHSSPGSPRYPGLSYLQAWPYVISASCSKGWRRQWHPTPVLLSGKSHGQRSLVGCSPWGRKELDTTEWLHFHFSVSCIGEGNGNPLQCSCLENPRDGGAWWAAVYGVSESRTRLKRLSSSSSSSKGMNYPGWWVCGQLWLSWAARSLLSPGLRLQREAASPAVDRGRGLCVSSYSNMGSGEPFYTWPYPSFMPNTLRDLRFLPELESSQLRK